MRKDAFTLIEMVVAVAIVALVLGFVNQLYVSSARQMRSGDEHATAAAGAATALEVIENDLRQMAVQPAPAPLSATYRLSDDQRSIAFERAEATTASADGLLSTTAARVSAVTLQLTTSPRGTGNYVLTRIRETAMVQTERTIPGVVLRDLSYEPLSDGGKNYLRISVTAMSRDDDLSAADPEYAPCFYSASSLFELQAPAARIAQGLPPVDAFAMLTPVVPSTPWSPGPVDPVAPPLRKPADVPPPPKPASRTVVAHTPVTPPPSQGPAPATTGTAPEPPAPPAPSSPPAGSNPAPSPDRWIAKNVPPALVDPVQKVLDSMRADNGDDYAGRFRIAVAGGFLSGDTFSQEVHESFTMDFSGKSKDPPDIQVERMLERMARHGELMLKAFFAQLGVDMDAQSTRAIMDLFGQA